MTEKTMRTKTFTHLVSKLIARLPVRSQDIVKKRFGLGKEKGETLEKIGSDYGITRERVRQIVTDAIKNITACSDEADFVEAEEKIIFTIKQNNGIIRESQVLLALGLNEPEEENSLKLFVECSKRIQVIEEKGLVDRSWAIEKDYLERANQVAKAGYTLLSEERRVLTDEEITAKLESKLPELKSAEILSFLKVIVKVQQNKFGKWGLSNWMEINPKGTREKIYLILKEFERPMHFSEIAEQIDAYKLGKRKAHPQTVHNELIKDDRFVLIGRGIYAMRQWGYSEGTIKDVLREILEKSRKPLSKEEILERVMRVRRVKKTTVMINLNDAEVFERIHDLYTLRKQ